jgi:hypothetical protein
MFQRRHRDQRWTQARIRLQMEAPVRHLTRCLTRRLQDLPDLSKTPVSDFKTKACSQSLDRLPAEFEDTVLGEAAVFHSILVR